jgi:hypothetical protein
MQQWLMLQSPVFADSESTAKGHLPRRGQMIDSNSNEHQLCFRSLFHSGRGYAFPCDPRGQVDLDRMSERARNNYFYARAMVGKELSAPAVEAAVLH